MTTTTLRQDGKTYCRHCHTHTDHVVWRIHEDGDAYRVSGCQECDRWDTTVVPS